MTFQVTYLYFDREPLEGKASKQQVSKHQLLTKVSGPFLLKLSCRELSC